MGQITSNIFDLDLENFSMAYTENENSDILPEIKEIPAKKITNQAEILKDKVQNIQRDTLLDNSDNEPCFKEIKLTKENFHQYQYTLLSQKNISYTIRDNEYRFITMDYLVFIITDTDLIKMILNMPRPRKIIYNNPLECFLTSSIYSMQLLANILENIKTNTLEELINAYKYNYKDEYTSLHTLITVFEKYEKIISKNQYSNYINFEQKIYNIFSSIKYVLDDELIKNRQNECSKLIQQHLNELNIHDKVNIDVSLDEFIKQIALIDDNDMIFSTLNKPLLNSINLDKYSNLVDLLIERESISTIIDKQVNYDTYTNGLISSFIPCIENYTNNIIVKGSYKNLFQRYMAEILRAPKFLDIINDNHNILEHYLIKNNTHYNDNILIMLEWVLIAYIHGCRSEEDYIDYIFTNYSTILSNSDIENLIKLLNTEFKELLSMIDDYSTNKLITDNIILHEVKNPFLNRILEMKRKLIKNLVLEVAEYIEDYNSKNNSKLYFIGYSNDSIYIECDPEALNVCVDTLTRTLVKVYDKYLKKTKAQCHIEKINKYI